jgi:DNA modification methylase
MLDGTATKDYEIIQGNALEALRGLPDESVQCCVTSPPYWALRNYSADGQIGLEKTPEMYVEKLVEVFNEVRRVLRSDGVLWLNLGDTYAGSWGAMSYPKGSIAARRFGGDNAENIERPVNSRLSGNLKPKDLVGIPWMVAFALRSSGWWLRSQIPWVKRSAMPESVTDRPAKALEDVFLLTKSERYFFDMDAVRVKSDWDPDNTKFPDGWDTGEGGHGSFHRNGREKGKKVHTPGNKTHRGATAYENGDTAHRTKAGLVAYAQKQRDRSLPQNRNGITGSLDETPAGSRNFRNSDLWFSSIKEPHGLVGIGDELVGLDVNPSGFSESHFATFPPKLIEPLILAGSREGDTVLDPFSGAATTGLVALRHRRKYLGIELNASYIEISERRLRDLQVRLF